MNTFIKESPLVLTKVRFLDHYMVNHKGFIAGGCFKNIFNHQKIKDIDLFFLNEKDFLDANDMFKKNDKYVFSYENVNTISYKNKETNIRVELIRKHFGTPIEILSMFDFSITKMAYCRDGENEAMTVIFHDKYFQDLANKKLVLEPNILYPISTFERSFRYCRYGFGLCKESKNNLINALKNTSTDDISSDLYFGID